MTWNLNKTKKHIFCLSVSCNFQLEYIFLPILFFFRMHNTYQVSRNTHSMRYCITHWKWNWLCTQIHFNLSSVASVECACVWPLFSSYSVWYDDEDALFNATSNPFLCSTFNLDMQILLLSVSLYMIMNPIKLQGCEYIVAKYESRVWFI